MNYVKNLPYYLTAATFCLVTLTASGAAKLTALHSFAWLDGSAPNELIEDNGRLYSTTAQGGNGGNGSVFSIGLDGSGFTNLYHFNVLSDSVPHANSDGAMPKSRLLLIGGTLYGTAASGGTFGNGTVFSVTTDGSNFHPLHHFTDSSFASSFTNSDGAAPQAGLVFDGTTLFGTTGAGGRFGSGTVYAIKPDGSGFTNLHDFARLSDTSTNADGSFPSAQLALLGNTLYGTTVNGGSSGAGTIFKLNVDGTGFTVLHSFSGGNGGAHPYAKLAASADTLYGTASGDGDADHGVIFSLKSDGSEFKTLHSFGTNEGVFPMAGLALSSNVLYGTTYAGGNAQNGSVFAVNTDGSGFIVLHQFTDNSVYNSYTNADGARPSAALLPLGSILYGTAASGGQWDNGTVFALTNAPVGSLTVTLIPDLAVAAGALWRVDNGDWQSSGATVDELSEGDHVVSFSAPASWIAPSNQTVAIVSHSTNSITATYTPVPDAGLTGSFSVTETWTLRIRNASGQTNWFHGTFTGLLNVTNGQYLMIDKTGLANDEVLAGTGSRELYDYYYTNSASDFYRVIYQDAGNYYIGGGYPVAFVSPASPTINVIHTTFFRFLIRTNTGWSGIQYPGGTFNEGALSTTGDALDNLSGTAYQARCQLCSFFAGLDTVSSLVPLGSETQYTINASASPSDGGQVSGSGTFATASSRTVTATPNKNYTFVNWTEGDAVVSTSQVYTFLLNSNRDLVAHFLQNPLATSSGTYEGLFAYSGPITQDNSGAVSVTVSSGGKFSAKLRMSTLSYSFFGQFSGAGTYSNSVPRKDGTPLSVQLWLDTANNQMNGSISDGTWSSDLMANRSTFSAKTNQAPQAGKYTLVIPGAADSALAPGGNGCGTVTVDGSGRVTFAGKLGDGTPVSQKTFVSAQGQWSIYLAPYGARNGSLLGWAEFANRNEDDLNGLVTWTRSAQPKAKVYPGGFTTQAEVIGSKYQFTSKLPVLALTNGIVLLENGNLPESLADGFSMDSNSRVIGMQSTNKLTLKITTSSGLFKGSMINPVTKRPLPFAGALLQKKNAGFGFFLGIGQSGSAYCGP